MSFKLLVAACCLLAAVQARPPKPPTTSCSVACVSRTFWTGYQVGKVYSYEFEQKVELTSELSTSQKSNLRLTGLAKVEVHSDCELALTVEVKESQVGDIDNADSLSPREPPSKVLDALRLPLRFSYENGQVVQLCPAEGETRASLNLKRGLLSQLQVSTEQRGQAHQLEERDILGDCWTEYTPEGPNTLLKTKDLANCKKLNYQVYPLSGVKSFSDEKIQEKQPITKGSLRCRIEIDPERDIVKETVCTEEQSQSADHGPQDSVNEKVRTSTRLSLKAEASGLVNALHEVNERTDLRHAHKTGDQCHSSNAWLEEDLFHSANECLERKHGAKTSVEFKAQAQKTLEDLCEITKTNQGMTREAPKKYADLIKYLRGVTDQEHFNQLYKLVNEEYCTENPLLKAIMRAAIPTVGTKQSVSLILDQLTKANIEGAHRDNWLINGIALMREPTVDILPSLLTYVKNRRDEAMLGVTRDEPLALSAVVHKICQERPENCESEPKVKAVIDYFSESLGPACEQFTPDADNAFVALLAVGNMGRVSGGAQALVRCAANPSLATVYRVFALHSLRRFDGFSPEVQDQLVELMLNSKLDSELRIAAYQALSRHSFDKTSRLHRAVQTLLNEYEEDRHVQMFVYTHAQNLRGEAAAQIAPVLRDARIVSELEKLSRHQYSNSLRAEYYSKNLGIGAQAEVPIVFSAQSALPRYIGLNLTVNMPSQGQSINLMEIGVRMQGLERLVEQIYRNIDKKFNPETQKAQGDAQSSEPAATDERQSELTAEQRNSHGKASNEPRIDLLVRQYGAELSHTDLSGGLLESIPEIIRKADFSSLPKRPSFGADSVGQSAGTLVENTLSIPTIAGLPILVKKELHYITNLRIESKVNLKPETKETSWDLKPAAAVLLSRTVAVDAIFERAGIQSRTSYLTSTGLRLSLKKSLESSTDRQFSFKIEPLVKKQNVADAKTEVNFFQHTAGKVHTEKPLVPQQGAVKREKCIEGLAKKYTGHKLCYTNEYLPGCKKSLRSFCQCPGSYQVFLEKSDDFGAYEVTFSLKKQDKNKQLLIMLGDQKSKDRLLKFNAEMVSESDKTKYKLELQNPIFPIVLDSSVTKDSDRYQVYTELQAGSVKYVASGSVQPNADSGIKVEGEIYPKEKLSQKVKLALDYKFDGFSPLLLPMGACKLQMRMHTGNRLELEYGLKHEDSKFSWQMGSQYRTSNNDVTSIRYRVELSNKDDEGAGSTKIVLYDFEVQNPRGNNLAHSLHAKVIRRVDAGSMQTTASVNHKLQYGVDKKRSPVDFESRITLKETIDKDLRRFSGDGELTYLKNGEPVTTKLESFKVQIGEVPDTTDGFGKQKLYAISYGIKYEENSDKYQVEIRHLQWKRWTKTQQAFELMGKATYGDKGYNVQLKHSLNGESYLARQIVKLEYGTEALFLLDHKMNKVEGTDSIKHEFNLQTPNKNKVQAKWGFDWPEQDTMNSDIVVDVNNKKVFGCKHTLRLTGSSSDHQLKHEMTLEMPPSSYSLETNARISRQSATDFADLMAYQVRLLTGRYRFGKSLRLLATLLRDLSVEQSTKVIGPTPNQRAILENAIDWSSESVMWKNLLKVTIETRDILNHGVILTRIRASPNGGQTWTWKDGLKLEIKALEQSLTTELESGWFKTSGEYKSMLKIASKDTWDWHDIKLDIFVKKMNKKWESTVKTEGKIVMFPITSAANVTLGSDDQDYIIATITNPGSKLLIRLNKKPSPLQLTASANLDGDFGILPVKEMKSTAEFSMQEGIDFETSVEFDGTKSLSAKLKINDKVFIADLKTAHPLLQEAGIKILMETDATEEAIKCNSVIRFIGLTRRVQIKKSGTVKLSSTSPMYSLQFGAAGNIEFEGLEDLISYKSLQYDLMLKKKPGMQFQFVTSIGSPDSSTKQPLLYLTSALNYWPVKVVLQLKTKLPALNYGVRAEIDYTRAFVGYEYKGSLAAVSYEIQDRSDNIKTVKFSVDCDFCSISGESPITGQANMTWPLKLSEFELGLSTQFNFGKLPMINFRMVHRPNNKQILLALVSNSRVQKLIDCSYIQTDIEDGVRGKAILYSDLRIFLGSKARAKMDANYQYGKDKELKFAVNWADSDAELLEGRMFWFSAPRSIDAIPVADLDKGIHLKGFGLEAYTVHSTKSDKSCEWHLSASHPKLQTPITGRLEVIDGKIKSGKISAFDRELTLSSSQDGSIQMTLRTNSDEAKTLNVKWSGNYESPTVFNGKLEIETEGKTNILEVKAQRQKFIVNYGRSTAPNVLTIEFEASDIDSSRDMTAEVKISHVTDSEKNSVLTLIPGVNVPMPATQYPFKVAISVKSWIRSLSISFEGAPSFGVKSMYYKHDFTTFPQSFSAEGNIIGYEESNKIWEMNIKVDKDVPTVEAVCQLSDVLKVSFKEPSFQLKIKNTIDLKIKFPKFLTGQDESGKKELAVKLALPVVKINEPISLKVSLEGQVLKIQYGRDDDDKIIMWTLKAHKFNLTPKFEIDWETSVTSKVDLWGIRSVEARLESSKDSLADSDDYALKYKTTLKVNGGDLWTTTVRLDSGENYIPKKGELTMTGNIECALKFDLGKKDSPMKIRFSMDKFGSSRDKYSMNLEVSPVKSNSWCPDFKLETECPHRQFVIGKQCDKTAGESTVEVQLYLNKRMDHGVTITYKVESPTTGVKKHTVEVDLPTRKLRAVWQPEISSTKLGVMTTFDWDADKPTKKIFGLDARVDFSSDVLAIIEFRAPFLNNRLRIEGRFENKENGFSLQMKHMKGESEALVIKADYSYQRQAQTNIARIILETTGAIESKVTLTTQISEEIEDFRRPRVDGTLKIKVDTYEKNVKFIYRPMREITVTCDHGASLSLKYSTDKKNMHQLVIFVSSNDKQAARLKLVLSKPLKQITAKLDIGSGSFNHNTDLRGPNYRPETVLMRTELTSKGGDLSATIFTGKMTVGQKPNMEDIASVPRHLSFFAYTVKKAEDNKRKFRLNYRIVNGMFHETFSKLKTSVKTFSTDSVATFGDAFDYVKIMYLRATPMVNGAWFAEELSNLASNDMDKLTLYFERATEKNELYLRHILKGVQTAGWIAKKCLVKVTEAATQLKETLAELKVVEKFAEGCQMTWDSVTMLLSAIPTDKIVAVIVEYSQSIKNVATSWMEKATWTVKSYVIGIYAMVSDASTWEMSEQPLSAYFEGLSPLTSFVKDSVKQLWSQTRSIIAACTMGVKSLVVDDLLPLGVNHLEDIKIVKDLYENVVLELRVWYDRGATPEERTALTRTTKLLNYVISEDSLKNLQYLAEGCKLIFSGEFYTGFKKLADIMYGQYAYTVWRPSCDAACKRGETFAAIEGYYYEPNYELPWPMLKAPAVVLKRITSKLIRKGLPESSILYSIIGSTVGVWNPAERLLTVRHRTAILTGDNQLITFDGLVLTHERPCNYLVAREFSKGLFSVVQEYRKTDKRQVRDRLRVRFGSARVSINRDGSVQLNDKTERLPLKKMTETGKMIEATSTDNRLTVRFHGNLQNTLVIQCSSDVDSCVISVHPLYQGSVNGLAGSNDGRMNNDIYESDASQHMRLWTAGQCVAQGSGSITMPESWGFTKTNDCYTWFRKPISPLAKCFGAVDPEPYLTLCQRQERLGRDTCTATRQYADRCNSENVNVPTPAKCEACRLDSDGEIAKAGLVSDKESLQKRIQVLFLVEDSACGLKAVGTGGSRIRSVASVIDRLRTNPVVKTIEFGLATYGGSDSPSNPVTKVPLSKDDGETTNRAFGTLAELGDSLARLQLTGNNDDTQASTDVLRAIAALPEQYQWRPLAQKHLIVVACKPCTAKVWNYASLFAKAQRSVKDQIFVHTISKTAVRPERVFPDIVGYDAESYHMSDWSSAPLDSLSVGTSRRLARGECSAELATESDTSAKGSVWRLEKFASSGEESSQTMQLLVTKEIQRHLENPGCRKCTCGGRGKLQWQQQPWCRIAKCDD